MMMMMMMMMMNEWLDESYASVTELWVGYREMITTDK